MATNTCTMKSPIHNGVPTAYWRLLMWLQGNGSATRARIVREVPNGQTSISTLLVNGMIVNIDRMWELTQKGKDYIKANEASVKANIGKPRQLSKSSQKYVLESPIINGRPTKFWLLMSKLYGGPIHKDKVILDGYIWTAKGLQQMDVPAVQYNRTTCEYSLTQAGIDYYNKNAAIVTAALAVSKVKSPAKKTPASPTSGLAPLGTPTFQIYVTYNGATFGFPDTEAAADFAARLKVKTA